MVNTKNEHVSPMRNKWIVRREGSKRISRFFGKRKDAMEYASVIAFNERGSVVPHKRNGQFKEFKRGDEMSIRKHKIGSILAGTMEMKHPIANNMEPILEFRSSV